MPARTPSNNKNDFPKWARLSQIKLDFMEAKLQLYVKLICGRIGYSYDNIYWCQKRLYYIFDMVKRRELYYHIFHEFNPISEYNESCLYVYWILKLRPFAYDESNDDDINLKIALRMFSDAVKTGIMMKHKEYVVIPDELENILEPCYDKLEHSFKSHDLSKEAIMLLANALIDTH
jgi:hypothetical protein